MKIYDFAGARNAARVRIVLAVKGLEDKVDFVRVDRRGSRAFNRLTIPEITACPLKTPHN
jgi:glutathione S-transferase